MSVAYPLINGMRYDWSSVRLLLAGRRFVGVKEFNYSDKLTPGKARGTTAQIIGRTRGEYEAQGSITLYKEDWADFLSILGTLTASTSGLNTATGAPPGFMEVAFDIVATFAESPASPVQTDTCQGCRIVNVESSNSQSADPLVVKLDLDIIMINRNGSLPLNVPLI